MEILKVAKRLPSAIAVRSGSKVSSYGRVLEAADRLASDISRTTSHKKDAHGPRIGVYAEPGSEYVASTWGTWLAGGIVVPLAVSHPPRELEYVLQDAGVSMVLSPPSFAEKLAPVCSAAGVPLRTVAEQDCYEAAGADTPQLQQPPHADSAAAAAAQGGAGVDAPDEGCLIIYTSGTTGRPKGALHTHRSVGHQMRSLSSAWNWSANDLILHALPLHHTHGIINALYCAHFNGATVNFFEKFAPLSVWRHLIAGKSNVFMGVPTMYSLLLATYDRMAPGDQTAARDAAAALRLTISGSAACPVPIMRRWEALSGQVLLERYGMTEIGMALSNPLEGQRRPGFVGLPLPFVETRLVVDEGGAEGGNGDGLPVPGELRVRGPTLFKEYWNRPEATADAFDEAGWFRTGDSAVVEGQPPYYKILGRLSADIIKSGGYKISALGIENALLESEAVRECAVLGLPDDVYGEAIAAVVALQEGVQATPVELRQFLSSRLPTYQLPKSFHFVDAIPRNAMGKVNKKELAKTLV